MAEKGDLAESTDGELVGMTLAGSHEAYRELVGRYQGHVYGLAYSLVSDWAEAQDVAQETFIRAYSNLDQLRQRPKFAAWLRRVAFGVAMDWLRTFRPKLFEQLDGRVDLDHLEIPDFQPGPPEIAAKRELADAVLAAVGSLPAKYRVPLTMFHLDGLSYKKVADFLDIPLGTAKSMIHRAKQKLKAALPAAIAEEIAPMVQEVFNEHKLPEEFAGKVLEGVPEITWRTGESTWCGSVVACMKFLNDPVEYYFASAVSGCAFKLFWCLTWCPSNNSMGIIGSEHIRRTFWALGRQYEYIGKDDPQASEDEFRKKIIESIDGGRPVIAGGIVGPPDPGVVAGYDQKGSVLLGRSYFHDGSNGYFQQSDWYERCSAIILIGAKRQPPGRHEILAETLRWAVQLARTPDMVEKRACGLAAYDAWAEALLRDENFPEGNLKTLTFRCNVIASVTLSGLGEARDMAAKFCRQFADVVPSASKHLLAAAGQYEQEGRILGRAMHRTPFCTSPEEDRLKMADRGLRRFLADNILRAKEHDQGAVEHLEKALGELQA